jgi:hypothetical protein
MSFGPMRIFFKYFKGNVKKNDKNNYKDDENSNNYSSYNSNFSSNLSVDKSNSENNLDSSFLSSTLEPVTIIMSGYLFLKSKKKHILSFKNQSSWERKYFTLNSNGILMNYNNKYDCESRDSEKKKSSFRPINVVDYELTLTMLTHDEVEYRENAVSRNALQNYYTNDFVENNLNTSLMTNNESFSPITASTYDFMLFPPDKTSKSWYYL